MAASDECKNVRIKVTFEAFQAANNYKIDSTKKWALIFFSECPTIQDVADKIVASSHCRLTSQDDSGSNSGFTSLELWLDGYLLPSDENSRILRDGDEIKAKTSFVPRLTNGSKKARERHDQSLERNSPCEPFHGGKRKEPCMVKERCSKSKRQKMCKGNQEHSNGLDIVNSMDYSHSATEQNLSNSASDTALSLPEDKKKKKNGQDSFCDDSSTAVAEIKKSKRDRSLRKEELIHNDEVEVNRGREEKDKSSKKMRKITEGSDLGAQTEFKMDKSLCNEAVERQSLFVENNTHPSSNKTEVHTPAGQYNKPSLQILTYQDGDMGTLKRKSDKLLNAVSSHTFEHKTKHLVQEANTVEDVDKQKNHCLKSPNLFPLSESHYPTVAHQPQFSSLSSQVQSKTKTNQSATEVIQNISRNVQESYSIENDTPAHKHKRRRRRKKKHNNSSCNSSRQDPNSSIPESSPALKIDRDFNLRLPPHLRPPCDNRVLFDDDNDGEEISLSVNTERDLSSINHQNEPKADHNVTKIMYVPKANGTVLHSQSSEFIQCLVESGNKTVLKSKNVRHDVDAEQGKKRILEDTYAPKVSSHVSDKSTNWCKASPPGPRGPILSKFVNADDKFHSLLGNTNRIPNNTHISPALSDKRMIKETDKEGGNKPRIACADAKHPDPKIHVELNSSNTEQPLQSMPGPEDSLSAKLQTIPEGDKHSYADMSQPCSQEILQGLASVSEIDSSPDLKKPPMEGDIIAYKVLELSADYTPVVSDYKKAQVLKVDTTSDPPQLEVFMAVAEEKRTGRFELELEEDSSDDETCNNDLKKYVATVSWADITHAKLIMRA